jgi:hypothetical protein
MTGRFSTFLVRTAKLKKKYISTTLKPTHKGLKSHLLEGIQGILPELGARSKIANEQSD